MDLLYTSSTGRKICKLRPDGPFKSPCTDCHHQWTDNNPAFGHIVCQLMRSLQVGPDLPDKPLVSVNQFYSTQKSFMVDGAGG